jgi:hypothetical protein
VIKELLTQDDFYDAIMKGEGVIVVTDKGRGRTAHPVSCPTLQVSHFVEKVIVNKGKNGRYYFASSFPEARRELDAAPCNCGY